MSEDRGDIGFDGYRFKYMKVDDSFTVPRNRAVTARMAVMQHKRMTRGWNWLSETLPDGSLKIWRTEHPDNTILEEVIGKWLATHKADAAELARHLVSIGYAKAKP